MDEMKQHAEICPVCGGRGTVPPDLQYGSTSVGIEQTCHGCGGCGWVVVPDRRADCD